MKKTLLISLMLLFVTLVSFSQPFSTARESAIAGGGTFPGGDAAGSNRSTPTGFLLYSNPFTCPPFNGLASETWLTTETAVDFVLDQESVVSIVRSWFLLSADPNTANWIIRIFDDQNCFPNNLLGTWNIDAADMNYEYVCDAFGFPIYDMWTYLNPGFPAQAGVTYWVVVQAVISSPYRAYWATSGAPGQYQDCMGAFRFPGQGLPDWYRSNTQGTGLDEFALELYASEEVPLSDWALYIGLGLILAFSIIRFRRII